MLLRGRVFATSASQEGFEQPESRPPVSPPPEQYANRMPKNIRRMITAPSPPVVGQFRPPSIPIPGAPMFLPTGAVSAADAQEAEGARLEREARKQELIGAVRDRLGTWQELAAAIRELHSLGMGADKLSDDCMLPFHQQTTLAVGVQVYDSIIATSASSPSQQQQLESAFRFEDSAELLYELRTLAGEARLTAALYLSSQGLSASEVRQLVKAMRERARRGSSCEGFSSSPGDCLALVWYKAAGGATTREEREECVQRGVTVADTDVARSKLKELLES